jgi:serine/threonine protein kinase/predicted Zn-dependent protease
MAESSAQRNPLEVLAEEFVARIRAGERPTLTEYVERQPDLAAEIRDLFPALVEMEDFKPGDQTSDFLPRVDTGGMHPLQIGEFRILREIGRGGMGVVYEALQETLGRHVALKVLPAGALADPRRAERFRREARAAAKLHHTNIVPVFGTGEADGLHYYAMQFIAGQGLDRVIDELRQQQKEPAGGPRTSPNPPPATLDEPSAAPASTGSTTHTGPLSGSTDSLITRTSGRRYWDSVARLGAQAASALAHAHAQGVLHRDIKPGNLLLDPQGTVWVADFGLAKLADEEDLTRAGDIVGTLRYMAPERFEGRCDARADIYALGLTLYELLTLRPAFDEKAREKLIAQVMQGVPLRPSQVCREVPRDLETIVLKALAREPEARYSSAAELAEDLQRFLEDRPIHARRAGPGERLWRWSRRNPILAGLTAAFALVLIGGVIAGTLAALFYRALAEKTEEARQEAEKNEATIRDDLRRLHEANGLLESGFRHAVRKDWPLALADYSSAIDLRPDHSQVWADRALLYLRLGLAKEAAGDFKKLFELREPNEPSWWYFHAALRLHVGDLDGYRNVCTRMREQFREPASPEVVRALVQTCTLGAGGIDKPKELLLLLKEAEERFPTEHFVSQRIATLFRAGLDREVAELTVPADPRKAATAPPADLCFRAMSLARLGQAPAAKTSLAAAGEKLDATASLLSMQSFGPRAADQFVGSFPAAQKEEALADWIVNNLLLDEASEGKSQHPLPLFIRARGCAALGWWDQADEATREAIQLCRADEKAPRLAEVALVERSRLNALRGRWSAVAQDLEQAGKFARPPYQLRELAAQLYSAHGRDADARQHLAFAIRQAPTDLNLRLERGRTSIRMMEWDTAASDLNAILNDERFMPRGGRGWSGFYSRYFPEGNERAEVARAQAAEDVLKQVREEIVKQDELYKHVQAQRPTDVILLLSRARYLLSARRFREAADQYIAWAEKWKSEPAQDSVLYWISAEVAPWDEVFEPLIRRWPDHVGLWTERAAWRLKSGDVDRAADEILHMLPAIVEPADPKPEREAIYTGLLLEQDKLFQAVAARRPQDADLWMARFRERVKRRDWEGAEQAAREVAKRRPANVATLRQLAAHLDQSPRAEPAAEYNQQALKLKPDDLWLLRGMFALNLRLQKWDAASEILDDIWRRLKAPDPPYPVRDLYNRIPIWAFEELCRRRPEDATLWIARGWVLYYARQYNDALPALKKAVQLSNDIEPCHLWVQAGLSLKDWDAVADALEHTRRLAARPGQPQPNIDRVYQGLPLASPQEFDEIARRRPTDELLWLFRGKHDALFNRWKEALTSFTRAVAIAPKNAEGWALRARAHAALAEWKEAALAFDRALSLMPPVPFFEPPPTGPSVYRDLMVGSLKSPRGKTLFEEVAQLRSKDGRLWLEYCRALSSDSYDGVPPVLRAELPVALDQLVKLAPKEPVAWLERARYRTQLGDFDKAADDYVAAAELLPKGLPLNEVSTQLYTDLATASKVFDRFTALRPNDPFPWSCRANKCSLNPADPHFLSWEADIKRAMAIRPDEPAFRSDLRRLLLECGLWDRAATEYAAEMKRQEPAAGELLWLEAAAAYAAAEKSKEYQTVCRRMVEVWNKLDTPPARQQLAWTMGLLPGSGSNLEPMLSLAEAAHQKDPKPTFHAATVALLHYRLGQYAKVLAVVQEHYRTHGHNQPIPGDEVVLDLLKVLALARNGKRDDAQYDYQNLVRNLDYAILVGGTRRRTVPSHVWAAVAVLRREADALLKVEPPRQE